MGALIIEDRPDVQGIPDQYANMPELILTLQVHNGAPVNERRQFLPKLTRSIDDESAFCGFLHAAE